MKIFESVTVLVEYRMDGGGGGVPDDRLVRARVAETVTTRGGVCRAFGDELIAPRKLTDRDIATVHVLCLAQLRGVAKRIVFEYEPLMALPREEYPISEVA